MKVNLNYQLFFLMMVLIIYFSEIGGAQTAPRPMFEIGGHKQRQDQCMKLRSTNSTKTNVMKLEELKQHQGSL